MESRTVADNSDEEDEVLDPRIQVNFGRNKGGLERSQRDYNPVPNDSSFSLLFI